MEIMFNFIKKTMKGIIERNPYNNQEFYKNILLYLFNNQIKEYKHNFEKSLYNTVNHLEREDIWELIIMKQRIRDIQEYDYLLEVFTSRSEKILSH
jgi:hypothetical protein